MTQKPDRPGDLTRDFSTYPPPDYETRRNARLMSQATGAKVTGGSLDGGHATGAGIVLMLAAGAVAIGAVAIGALAIGRLVVGDARFRRLEIDDLVVRRLTVLEP